MKCWRIDLQRGLSRYLHGELDTRRAARIECHLLDCGECRATLSRLKTSNAFVQTLEAASPERDRWDSIRNAIASKSIPQNGAAAGFDSLPRRPILLRPAFALITSAVVLLIAAALLVYSRMPERQFKGALALDIEEFHPVSISEMDRATKAHVVAEGFVSEVKINDEDGDLSFKLVENLDAREPFIICEIMDPIRLEPPRVGSRVRVYGVSRYDNQADHNWYEVHPVLNIEVVRR